MPLVTEAFDWSHGVYLAANIASEGTAAAENAVGALRRDPFAMLPFCGYNMGDYFAHWLRMGAPAASDPGKLPRIYLVNWFRKDATASSCGRASATMRACSSGSSSGCEGTAEAVDSPIGRLPAPGGLDLTGLDLSDEAIAELFSVDPVVWRREAQSSATDLAKLGNVPPALLNEQRALEERLAAA